MPPIPATPKPPAGARPSLSIPVGMPFRDWLDAFAESERVSIPTLVDRAVCEYAASRDHASPPPRMAKKPGPPTP